MRNRLPNRLPALLLALLMILLTACGGAAAPEGQPDITGTITNLDDHRVLIEENPDEKSGSDKAYVFVDSKTRLYRQADGGRVEPARFADLAVGQKVQAWFAGPVRESYPVQADGRYIIILSK